jgi:RNA polymerase sigma-B factor
MLPNDPRTDVVLPAPPEMVATDEAATVEVPAGSAVEVPVDVATPVVPAQRQDERNGRDERTRACFAETLTCSSERRSVLLDEIVTLHMGVARSIAVRYRDRGVALDDLVQVAYLGLTKAARGFDPEHGGTFLAYAVPTITGEVRRYFRDHAWQVRPPRRIQELQAEISRVRADAMRAGNASPTVNELVAKLDADADTVIEALGADGCFQPAALDMPNDEGHTLADVLGMDDAACRELDTHLMLAPAIRRLGDRDRHVLGLRFFQDWTQEQIARDIGVTQMQVSRILTRILATLRRELSEAAAEGDSGLTDANPGREGDSAAGSSRRGARAA